MTPNGRLWLAGSAMLFVLPVLTATPAAQQPQAKTDVTFMRDVAPILQRSCMS